MNKPITYQEPTYTLHLQPVQPAKKAEKKGILHKDLSTFVSYVAMGRPEDPSTSPKARKEIAHSLMHRPDQIAHWNPGLEIAEKQRLIQHVVEQLNAKFGIEQEKLTSIAKTLFSDYPSEEKFLEALSLEIHCAIEPFHEGIYDEMWNMRQELKKRTTSKMVYIRPPQDHDGHSYTDHNGNVVTPSMIPSSYDRKHTDVQNARLNLDGEGKVVYSTGRIETKRKANQVIDKLLEHVTFDNLVQQDGKYVYPIVVENLVNFTPAIPAERKLLTDEREVLRTLKGQTRKITLNGKQVVVELRPILFATHANQHIFLGQNNRWSSTGSQLAEEVSDEGLIELVKIWKAKGKDKEVEFCLKKLAESKTQGRIQDRFILRAFICEKLNISYHIHCKSSKDRTAAVAAIKKAVHQWIRLEMWKNGGIYPFTDPRKLFDNPVFREYSEAALFENLPMTDQGVGFEGELDGKIYTSNRGLDYQFSLLEHPLAALVLTDRHLHRPHIIKRVISGLAFALSGVVLGALYIGLTPVIAIPLIIKYRSDAWEAYKYFFLFVTIFPAASATREAWINRDSEVLKERRFLRKH